MIFCAEIIVFAVFLFFILLILGCLDKMSLIEIKAWRYAYIIFISTTIIFSLFMRAAGDIVENIRKRQKYSDKKEAVL